MTPTLETEAAKQTAAAQPLPAVAAETAAPIVTAAPSHIDRSFEQTSAPVARIELPDGPLLTGVSEKTEAAFQQLLSRIPKIPLEHWGLIYGFVIQVPWMIWLLNDERRQQAAASGRPPPSGPVVMLSTKDRETAMRLASKAPPYFIPFCKSLFAFLREHGTDVLELAPVPFHPLPHSDQQPLLQVLRDPNQRAYAEYVCRWQDALLNDEKIPEEPQLKIRSDRKHEIRKLLVDLRAVMLFKHRATNTAP